MSSASINMTIDLAAFRDSLTSAFKIMRRHSGNGQGESESDQQVDRGLDKLVIRQISR